MPFRRRSFPRQEEIGDRSVSQEKVNDDDDVEGCRNVTVSVGSHRTNRFRKILAFRSRSASAGSKWSLQYSAKNPPVLKSFVASLLHLG